MAAFKRGIHPQAVPSGVTLIMSADAAQINVKGNDPARAVMTDLSTVTPFQIESSASIEEINNKMIACGVRLLFVNNLDKHLIGIITATDILGEKPLLHVTHNGGTRGDITAQDLMTPMNKLEGIPFKQVLNSQVSDIVLALKEYQQHHILVLEDRENEKFVRGLFSVTQVSRQLGIDINPSERAASFAQLHKALS